MIAAANYEALHPSQVHLWYAFLPQRGDEIEERQLALLSSTERAQHNRFLFEKDRHRYVVTRALVRSVLSRYAPVSPKNWMFEPGPYGRPRIANRDPQAETISFNVSHCDDLVVVAVTTGREIGVDAESTHRAAPLDLAFRYFSPSEVAALKALPDGFRPARFWELWTLKESYIKARSMGLSLPLDKITFLLEADAHVSATFQPELEDDSHRWGFWQFRPDDHHLIAICLERAAHPDVQFFSWQAQPPDAMQSMDVVISRTPLEPWAV